MYVLSVGVHWLCIGLALLGQLSNGVVSTANKNVIVKVAGTTNMLFALIIAISMGFIN